MRQYKFKLKENIEYKNITKSGFDAFKKAMSDNFNKNAEVIDKDFPDIENGQMKEIYKDGKLIGYVGFSVYDGLPDDDYKKALGIGNFIILEKGKGLGTEVIHDIVEKYKNIYDLIYCFVDAHNAGAIKLYKRLGKVYDEDGPNDEGNYYVVFYKDDAQLDEDLDTKSNLYFLSEEKKDKNLVNKDLKESRADQEAFINKFGKEAFDFFQKYKQRLINANISTDITFHTKNTSKEEMGQIISDLKNKVVKDDTGATKLNRKYIGSEKGYEVYQPLDWETSMNMGEDTSWCITGRYQTEEVKPSQAKQYFNEYVDKGIRFYFFMKNNTAEYCIALYPKYLKVGVTLSTNFELWDKNDENVTRKYSEIDLPYNLIPDLKIDIAKKIGNLYIKDNVVVSCEKDAKEVVIPDNVTSIGKFAFASCHSLTSITIPRSITSVGERAFSFCRSLTSITIPDSITSIGKYVFNNCSNLTSITIPNSVSSIEAGTFSDCGNLTSITIPNSITGIGNNAFLGCDSLTNITFQGTKAQWNAIRKGSKWNLYTGSYTVHCIDGDINKHPSISESLKDTSIQNNSKLVEIYPDKGESKKDFIKRFMSVTKDEYPDIKQRYAVANSYWDRRDKKSESLTEATRSQLISKSRKGDTYKKSQYNRWLKKTDCNITNTVKDYNKIDMNAFWKQDYLNFGIKVEGKTNTYTVYVSFINILNRLQKEVKANKNKLTPDIIYKALLDSMNTEDVKINCSCPDYQYRLKYYASKNGFNQGKAETRPSKITNPDDTKGAACKHALAVINNLEWLKKIASVINNYVNYYKDNMQYNYGKFIFPKIYGMPYEKAVQLTIDDYDDKGELKSKLESDEALVNLSNALGKVRGRFKKKENK